MWQDLLQFLIDNSVKLMIMVGMTLLMMTTKNHFPKHVKKYIYVTFWLIFVYSFVASGENYITGLGENIDFSLVMTRRVLSFLGYGLRPFIIVFATFIMVEFSTKDKWLFCIPAIASAALHLSGLWCGFVTTINSSNVFVRGPLGYISFVVAGLYVAFLIYVFVHDMVKGKAAEGTIGIFIIVSCLTASVLDMLVQESSNYLGNVLCVSVLFYYLYLNVEYAKKFEDKLKQSQQDELMLSQVRPHFMYNVLTSIYYLCDHDPQKAKKAVNAFSLYLRNNLDTIRSEQMVNFETELGYVKNYLSLEKIRFEDELNFDFDTPSTGFQVPKFTLQPLVENAVKHGVTQKEGGGSVHIYTREENNYYIVGVKDDGVGFDPNVKKNDGRSHTGVENINNRLREFLNEELHIESKIGEGTHIWFRVPKKKN